MTLPPGVALDRYLEVVLGQDVSFAWHHVQVWAEAYEARFEIPGVGNADTQAYYVEAKYKFTPQLFGALRWNQQFFSDMAIPGGGSAPWSRDVTRVDAGPGFRFTAHTQLKLQYSIEHQNADMGAWSQLVAIQFTTRF
jgi:predicted porin